MRPCSDPGHSYKLGPVYSLLGFLAGVLASMTGFACEKGNATSIRTERLKYCMMDLGLGTTFVGPNISGRGEGTVSSSVS